MKVTILVDNNVEGSLQEEFGLAMWIETDDAKILFDTGQGRSLEHNCEALGIDISTTDQIVFSHGHYDHTGGLPWVLESARPEITLHPGAFVERYSAGSNVTREIGFTQPAREALKRLPDNRILRTDRGVQVVVGAWVTGAIPKEHPLPCPGRYYLDDQLTQEDPFDDDQAMVLRTSKGLVVLLGCCHSGLENTIEHVCRLFGGASIHAVIGGCHLVHADEEQIVATARNLEKYDIDYYGFCHCSGSMTAELFKQNLPSKVEKVRAGMSFEF